MSHRAHPIDDDPPAAFLWDDCERCAEQADQPTALDKVSLSRAWELMLAVERSQSFVERENVRYLTAAEARLCRNLNLIYVVIERLGGVNENGRFGNV